MQELLVFQSIWAMERRHSDGFERSLEQNLEMIVEGGFAGVSAFYTSREEARRVWKFLDGTGLQIEGLAFPQSVDELKPSLEFACEFPVHHINLQPNVRPRTIQECTPFIEGWRQLAEEVSFPVLIETHRDRMTTDLFFTLDLLEVFPDLPLLADLSHYLVGREFDWPVDDVNHAMIHRILDNSWAFHGRVASREQVQIEISYEHHRQWLDLFLTWWEYGFRSWRKRSPTDATLAFTCELGPKPYAITGSDGNDSTDRWAEALRLKDLVTELWERIASEAGAGPDELGALAQQ